MENTMQLASDSDDFINDSSALPVQNNNYGVRNYLRYDNSTDNKDKKARVVGRIWKWTCMRSQNKDFNIENEEQEKQRNTSSQYYQS